MGWSNLTCLTIKGMFRQIRVMRIKLKFKTMGAALRLLSSLPPLFKILKIHEQDQDLLKELVHMEGNIKLFMHQPNSS